MLRLLLPETYNSRRAVLGASGTFPVLRLQQAGKRGSLNYHWLLSSPKPPGGLAKGRQAAGERQDKMSPIGPFKTIFPASLPAAWVQRRGRALGPSPAVVQAMQAMLPKSSHGLAVRAAASSAGMGQAAGDTWHVTGTPSCPVSPGPFTDKLNF